MLNIDVTVIYVPNFILASYIKLKFEKHELTNEANLSTYTDQASHHHVTTLIISSSWPFGYSMQKTNEYFVLKVSRKTGVRMRVLPGSSCDGLGQSISTCCSSCGGAPGLSKQVQTIYTLMNTMWGGPLSKD